jgi:endonuclease/exonuclease/phosphatase family metal-dependent hydrolase
MTGQIHSARAMSLIVASLAALSCVQQTISERPFDIGPSDRPFVVASYNIRHGEGMDGRVDLDRTAGAIRALGADVVALQEVDVNTVRSGKVDQPDSLGKLLRMERRFGAFMPYQGGEYGLAILSRHPIISAEVVRLPDGNEPRVMLMVQIARYGETVVVANVHFDWVESDSLRYLQAFAAEARLARERRPLVLAGDFNDQPGSRTMALFAARFSEVAKAGTGATFPADGPVKPIDHVYAAPTSAWVRAGALVGNERVASDHRPVIATLWRAPPR